MIPIILSGGSGTRLWPISRTKYPKQFCELFDESLQSLTLNRLSSFGKPMIITSILLRDFTEKKALEAGIKNLEIIFEPEAKNTAPAIATLCKIFEMRGQSQEIVGVFPADHLIEDQEEYLVALQFAEKCAIENKVVTLGLKPSSPATGYGYIQTEKKPQSYGTKHSSYNVLKFHEKPNLELAMEFLSEGSFYWNAGIFIFPIYLMIDLFKKFQPQIWQSVEKIRPDLSNLKEIYKQMPSISIDYAIMEKLSDETLICVPCDPGWSDMGSWDAVASVYESTGRSRGNPIEVDSKNNFVLPHNGKKYAFVGVDDLIVIDTYDALLLAQKGKTQDVKLVVDRLKKENSKLIDNHSFEERPWGRFEVMTDKSHFKTKVIRVNVGAQISYQSHERREEHWIITQGEGEMTLNEEKHSVTVGTYVKIPLKAKHRVRNTGRVPLEIVEVQLGTYFGEDDIIRYHDDYKRVEI